MRRISLTVVVSLALIGPVFARDQSGENRSVSAGSGPVDNELAPVAVPEPSALARRYYLTGNWIWAGDQFWSFAVNAMLLFSGASARVRDVARRVGRSWWLTVGLYAALYTTLIFLFGLPLSFYQGYIRQHAYGLSNQTLGRWLGNALKRLALSAGVGFLFTWVPFLILLRSPRRWWLYTTLLTVPFLLGVALIQPVFIDPLFNDYVAMKDRALEAKILAQARRAGIDGSRVFEVNKSRDTKAVNAYVTGLLGTKRIVLWDTLLAKLNEREVLFVLGHEMGHYVLGHVVRSILLSSVVILATLFWVDRSGRWLIERFRPSDRADSEWTEGPTGLSKSAHPFGFERLSDIAAVPLILMMMQVASLALTPVANAYSRFQEYEADRFALELTRTNHSGGLAFVKLQEENLSNPRPGPVYRWFRATHPSIGERIDFCNAYHPWTKGGPLVYGQFFQPETRPRVDRDGE